MLSSNVFDLNDESIRQLVGRALRTTYELDTPLPPRLQDLMNQLQQRLEDRMAQAEKSANGGDAPVAASK